MGKSEEGCCLNKQDGHMMMMKRKSRLLLPALGHCASVTVRGKLPSAPAATIPLVVVTVVVAVAVMLDGGRVGNCGVAITFNSH